MIEKARKRLKSLRPYIEKCRYYVERRWITIGLITFIILTILSIISHHKGPPPLPPEILAHVEGQTITPEPLVKKLTLTGQTQANRVTFLRSEVSATVVALPAEKGDIVQKGQEIITFEEADRPARLAEAKARFAYRLAEFEAGSKLASKAFKSPNAQAAAKAELEAARANLAAIEKEIKDIHLRAPFTGVLEDQKVEIGSYVNAGEVVAKIVELHPLKVVCAIAEKDMAGLSKKNPVTVRIPCCGVGPLKGRISFISRSADPKTRTFDLEITFDNPGLKILEGVMAEITIEKESIQGFKIPASVLCLSDEGVLGVKTVEKDHVKFIPVTLLEAAPEWVWVTGLTGPATLITVGGEFVKDGQRVNVSLKDNT